MNIIHRIVSITFPKRVREKISRKKKWVKFSERFNAAIQQFVIEKGISDPAEIRCWKKKLVKAFVNDNWFPDEYFFFNYEHLSKKGRYEFIPNREASKFWNYLNTKEIYLLTCDKGQTYQHFKDYYKRELISVSSENVESLEAFKEFAKRHDRFIIKPTHGNYGNGVRIIEKEDLKDIDSLVQGLLQSNPKGFTAEELIIQCEELASFHPSSVNTIRLTTARQENGEIYIIQRPFIRLGQQGRCVDNGGNGGIIAGIDYETGIIKGAVDERMNQYVIHPDSKKTILGFKIPKWEEAKAFVRELANVLPDLKYCGWDLALTDNGWVMVEANGKGLFIGFQMPTQEGFREEFENLKKLCGFNG